MSDLSDRVGRIEGELNHLATKSDIAEAKSELLVQIASIEGQLSILIWANPCLRCHCFFNRAVGCSLSVSTQGPDIRTRRRK